MQKFTIHRYWPLLLLEWGCHGSRTGTTEQWSVYGGDKQLHHYSALAQIDTNNVSSLKPAWIYHTNDADNQSQIQVNPIIIDDVLYGITPKLKLFAVEAGTGKEKWIFDPAAPASPAMPKASLFGINTCRGLAAWRGNDGEMRLYYTAGSFLYCIDAATGAADAGFGEGGRIDLHEGLGRDAKNLYVTSTTPPTVYKDLLIVGTRVGEDATAAPGHIRAYDVFSGKPRWIFHTIPQPGEDGYDSWEDKDVYKYAGGVNAWSGFSLDEEKGVLFAPLGSASPDFYGGQRRGNDLFANCVLALDAATGKQIWHFQSVHHDVWDRDLPTPPVLVTIRKNGQAQEAIAQVTKTGMVFVLDRKTGQPVYPVEERTVPAVSELPGELLSPTQPISSLPPFVRQTMTDSDLNHLVPDSSYQEIRRRLSTYKTGNMFNPPSRQGTVIFPGFDGGAEWGGPAYDSVSGLLYVNASEIPWILTMIDAPKKITAGSAHSTNLEEGVALYKTDCQHCHGDKRQGGENFPALTGLKSRYNPEQFASLVSSGRRMMPAFPQLSVADKAALASFLLDLKAKQREPFTPDAAPSNNYSKTPYVPTGYNKFLTKEGYPAVAPPWGTLTAIDLSKGEIVWKEVLGDYPELKAKGIHTGTENYGGPVVTAGGLLFIAATRDGKFRAFNKRTGRMLWETTLPACGFATPAVYSSGGKQYVMIACGGGKLHQPSGDAYVAFALPGLQ